MSETLRHPYSLLPLRQPLSFLNSHRNLLRCLALLGPMLPNPQADRRPPGQEGPNQRSSVSQPGSLNQRSNVSMLRTSSQVALFRLKPVCSRGPQQIGHSLQPPVAGTPLKHCLKHPHAARLSCQTHRTLMYNKGAVSHYHPMRSHPWCQTCRGFPLHRWRRRWPS